MATLTFVMFNDSLITSRRNRGLPPAGRLRRGFSLIELLVVVSIIALLLTLVAGAANRLRQGSRGLTCRSNLRVVGFDFITFADENAAGYRGKRSEKLGRYHFYFSDFVDSAYRVNDFWPIGKERSQVLDPSKEPLMCPSGADQLVRIPDRPCNDGAITPTANVSHAFNRRLFEQTIEFRGRFGLEEAVLDARVLEHPEVPLVFDCDGETADRRAVRPYFSAPAIEGYEDAYSSGRYWFPAMRHLDKLNVMFIGGHALSSSDPLHETGWDWKYQIKPFTYKK